jgi:hypothetical protein
VADAEALGTERSGRPSAANMLGEMLKKYPDVKVAKLAAELKTAYESKGALR